MFFALDPILPYPLNPRSRCRAVDLIWTGQFLRDPGLTGTPWTHGASCFRLHADPGWRCGISSGANRDGFDHEGKSADPPRTIPGLELWYLFRGSMSLLPGGGRNAEQRSPILSSYWKPMHTRPHRLRLQYHPDKVGGGDDATKKFNEIKSAREPPGGAPGSWEPRGVPSSSVRRG